MSRSAISASHEMFEGVKIGAHPVVVKFMHGAYKQTPPKPRYVETWDVTKVLDILSGPDFNPDSEIRLRLLKRKAIMLIMISTACRQSVIPRLQRSEGFILDRGDHFILHPNGWDKTSRFSKTVQDLLVFTNKENSNISPYDCLQTYLARSRTKSDSLFVSDTRGKPLLPSEVSVWVSHFLDLAEIPRNFKTHSLRGASTSKAKKILSSATIMEAADWKSENTFRKFYLRNIQSDSAVERRRSFQNAILK